ncbi:MAG: thiamine ABC transporter substrate-binding protein [Anaerolineales bacterium]
MKKLLFPLLILSVLLAACGAPAAATPAPVAAANTPETAATALVLPTDTAAAIQPGTPSEARTLTVMTHDSFAASQGVIQEFELANNVKVNFVKSGDAGAALNKAILSKDAPLADVFYGVDNTFLSRALAADIFESYDSPMLANIPAEFQLDLKNRALPVDYGDVCINYSKAFFDKNGLALPASLDDLKKPEYKDMLVVENPASSSPGLAFLLATIAQYGDPGYLDYWKALKANGVVVVDGWETAYYTNFSGSSGHGPQPMVVSYASSPAAEVADAATPLTDSPIGTIMAPGTCFRQVEFVGVLNGAKNRDLAEKFVDFMLDVPFQEDMPLNMYVYPVNTQAKLPDVFLKYAQVAASPAAAPANLDAMRDTWINNWTQAVLH